MLYPMLVWGFGKPFAKWYKWDLTHRCENQQNIIIGNKVYNVDDWLARQASEKVSGKFNSVQYVLDTWVYKDGEDAGPAPGKLMPTVV